MSEVSKLRLVVVLGAALVAVSSSAVLVRTVEEASPLALAFWRCAGSTLLVVPAVRSLPKGPDRLAVLLSGGCLAAHFVTWFASLSRTTVLHSTLLVCLAPLWVGVAEAWIHRRRPHTTLLLGAGIAVVGAALMAGESSGRVTWQGDLLAAVGGVLSAAYLLLGRRVRARVALSTYAAGVTGTAALLLAPVALATQTPLWGFSGPDVTAMVACVLLPQLVGHNGLNWALRHVPASTVSSLLLLEPVGAALLAALVLGEVPGALAAAGGLLAVAGVIVAVRSADPGA